MPDDDVLTRAKAARGNAAAIELIAYLTKLANRHTRQLEAVRAQHWPSPTRNPVCDCYDGLTLCPTVAILDGNRQTAVMDFISGDEYRAGYASRAQDELGRIRDSERDRKAETVRRMNAASSTYPGQIANARRSPGNLLVDMLIVHDGKVKRVVGVPLYDRVLYKWLVQVNTFEDGDHHIEFGEHENVNTISGVRAL